MASPAPAAQHRVNVLFRHVVSAAAVAETQDAEESQSCVVVTIVILAKGGINVTEGALRDKATFRSSMQHVSNFDAAYINLNQGGGVAG